MVDATSDPALMLDFKSEIKGIPTIDLTAEEAVLHYPSSKGNIAHSGGAPAMPSASVLKHSYSFIGHGQSGILRRVH